MRIRYTSIIGVLSLFLIASTQSAPAALIVDVTGVSGSGQTTWTFSGSDTARENNSIRATGGVGFSARDTTEMGSPNTGDFIALATIQDSLLNVVGTASITIGGNTESITQVFLDNDASYDDFGIRTANELFYLTGDATSWTGSFVVPVDIDAFNLNTFSHAGVPANNGLWFQAGNLTMTFSETSAVPEGGTLSLFGLGLLALALTRKAGRRHT